MRMPASLRWVVITLLASHCPPGSSESREPVPLELLQQRETIHSARLSPDGKWVAVVITKTYRDDSTGGAPQKAGTNTLRIIHTSRAVTYAPVPTDMETNLVAWSPDATQLAFDVESPRGRHLALWNADTAALRSFDAVALGRGGLLWSADGKALFATLEPDATAPAANAPRFDGMHVREQPSIPGSTVTLYRSSPETSIAGLPSYRSNDLFRGDLARIDPHTGAVTTLTSNLRPQSIRLSPNGRRLAFATLRGQQDGNGYRHVFDLVVVDAEGSLQPRIVATNIENTSTLLDFSWSPDGRYLAYVASNPAATAAARNCYLVAVDTGEQRLLRVDDEAREPDQFLPARAPLWTSHGDFVYLLGDRGLWRAQVDAATVTLHATIDGRRVRQVLAPRDDAIVGKWAANHSLLVTTRDDATKAEGIYRIDLSSGASSKLFEAPVALGSAPRKLDMAADGLTRLYTQESADRTEQLWLSDARARRPRQLTRLNPQLDAYRFGTSRLISWRTADGKFLHGALLLPANYSRADRCPLILESYPGDRLSDGLNLFGGSSGYATLLQNTQVLATRGYCVLSVDTLSNAGTSMRDFASSVLPAIDAAVDLGIADPARLGVKGHSSGGYAALSLLVQSHRFKAAVVTAGFGNLFGMHGQMHHDGTHWSAAWVERPDNMAGTPWTHRDRYLENSPYFHLDRVQAAVLLIHGAQDTAVSPHLADEIFVALRRLGKPVEYARYAGEGHLILKRANGIDAAARMIAWYDEHLGALSHE